ncbi:unnamed protein product [Cyprideis torosa]|uniref:Uncharacterized protein n=1 Tax=Cyprideis torosa TaxID=163714 RepID=A0A7R8ZLQ5_9CRUS|nr:unnamed protein product [Cyprideis torosa]CAG0882715.1 unnamed protein product [Cyprideis torosa]
MYIVWRRGDESILLEQTDAEDDRDTSALRRSSLLPDHQGAYFHPCRRSRDEGSLWWCHFTVKLLKYHIIELGRTDGTQATERKKYDTAQETDNMRYDVKGIDKDGSGYIDLAELKTALDIVGFRLPMYQVRVMVEQMGRDRNGRLSFDEFQKVGCAERRKLHEKVLDRAEGYWTFRELVASNHKDDEQFCSVLCAELKSKEVASTFKTMVARRENLETFGGMSDASSEGTTHAVRVEEQEAFTDWINRNLGSDPDLKHLLPIDKQGRTLYEKIEDGILLCKIINHSCPETIDERAINKKNLTVYTKHENLTLALNSAQSIGCNIINIDAHDLAKGKPHLVLGLLWQIIRIGLFNQITLEHCPGLPQLLDRDEKIDDLMKMSPEDILKRWVNYHLDRAGVDRRLNNFTNDVKDSEVYSHLLSQIAPKDAGVTTEALYETDLLKRAEIMLAQAQKLGCRAFVSPQDVIDGIYKLNLAFVANLFNNHPGLDKPTDVDASELENMEETREEKTYRNWMNSLGVSPHVNWLYSDLADGIIIFQTTRSRGHRRRRFRSLWRGAFCRRRPASQRLILIDGESNATSKEEAQKVETPAPQNAPFMPLSGGPWGQDPDTPDLEVLLGWRKKLETLEEELKLQRRLIDKSICMFKPVNAGGNRKLQLPSIPAPDKPVLYYCRPVSSEELSSIRRANPRVVRVAKEPKSSVAKQQQAVILPNPRHQTRADRLDLPSFVARPSRPKTKQIPRPQGGKKRLSYPLGRVGSKSKRKLREREMKPSKNRSKYEATGKFSPSQTTDTFVVSHQRKKSPKANPLSTYFYSSPRLKGKNLTTFSQYNLSFAEFPSLDFSQNTEEEERKWKSEQRYKKAVSCAFRDRHSKKRKKQFFGLDQPAENVSPLRFPDDVKNYAAGTSQAPQRRKDFLSLPSPIGGSLASPPSDPPSYAMKPSKEAFSRERLRLSYLLSEMERDGRSRQRAESRSRREAERTRAVISDAVEPSLVPDRRAVDGSYSARECGYMLEAEPGIANTHSNYRTRESAKKLYDIIRPGIVDWNRVHKKFSKLRKFMEKLENCNYAVELGKKLKFSLVGIAGQDLNDGNPTLTLALIWQLMRAYTLSILARLTETGSPVVEKEIIEWVNRKLKSANKSSSIRSFQDGSVADGKVIIDLIDSIKPGTIDYELVMPGGTEDENMANAKYAISMSRKIGARIYALPEDIAEVKPKMVMTVFACLMARDYIPNMDSKGNGEATIVASVPAANNN